MVMDQILSLIGFVLTPVLISGAIAFVQKTDIDTWYKTLVKPPLNPPNWIFGPVWFTLYVMIGVSGFLVWNSGVKLVDNEFTIYGIQLFMNFIWSLIFFKAHAIFIALIDILLLLGFIVLNIIVFYPISSVAAYLLIPYLCWVSFATYLNLSIWYLNRGNKEKKN